MTFKDIFPGIVSKLKLILIGIGMAILVIARLIIKNKSKRIEKIENNVDEIQNNTDLIKNTVKENLDHLSSMNENIEKNTVLKETIVDRMTDSLVEKATKAGFNK